MEPSANKISPSFQCLDAIEVSLCIEKQGLVFYEKASKTAADPRVREIFSRLAGEEKEHIQSLQAKARFLQPALVKKSVSRKNRAEEFIANELDEKVFPVPGWEDGLAGKVSSDEEALDIGIEAEKRSIKVLSRLIEREKKMDVRAIFNHLLAEERKHLAALEKLKRSWGQKGAGEEDSG
ncbi:hypothetical protein UZ36_04400 [Candidatus Nitromaritima sp. SCGC AAA799-C22]|nr:hypothetical protein UZ36_04400 [Candidatus Nitromaritima sp. SCGC AAA799-C22]